MMQSPPGFSRRWIDGEKAIHEEFFVVAVSYNDDDRKGLCHRGF